MTVRRLADNQDINFKFDNQDLKFLNSLLKITQKIKNNLLLYQVCFMLNKKQGVGCLKKQLLLSPIF